MDDPFTIIKNIKGIQGSQAGYLLLIQLKSQIFNTILKTFANNF